MTNYDYPVESPDSISLIKKIFGSNSKAENDAIAAWVKQQYRAAKDARSVVERQWYLNMAFYYGRQNVQFVNTSVAANGFRLHVPQAPPWRVRMVINKIRTIIRTEVSKLTSQKPNMTVVPATTEDEDIAASRAAEMILMYLYHCKDIQSELKRATWWTSVCGNGFMKVYWDSTAIDYESNQQGDMCVERIAPFYIFVPDLRQESIEKQPWVIHATTRSVSDVQRLFNIHVTEKVNSSSELLDESFLSMVGSKPSITEEVLVLECWIKPNGHKDFPGGGLVTIVGDKVAQVQKKWPYTHHEFPFVKLDHVLSGKFYTTSVIEDLIPVQREYNRTRSQIIESKNRTSKPQFIYPEGTIDPRKITSEPGQGIPYKPGLGKPEALPLQSIPPYVIEELTRLQMDFDDISAQHEISRGGSPPQVTAATAISFLQEQDDSKLSAAIESIEKGVEKTGRLMLGLVKQYWTTPRYVRSVGGEMIADAREFSQDDITGTKSNTDVRVEAGSALSASKAARQAIIMDLMKNQLIPPEMGLQRLEMGGLEKLYEDVVVDIRQAERENLRMSAGEQLFPNTWDNHEVHQARHDKFRKSQQFELLDEQIKMIYEQHVALHSQAIMAQQMQQMQMQQSLDGQQGPGNTGPKPPSQPPGGGQNA